MKYSEALPWNVLITHSLVVPELFCDRTTSTCPQQTRLIEAILQQLGYFWLTQLTIHLKSFRVCLSPLKSQFEFPYDWGVNLPCTNYMLYGTFKGGHFLSMFSIFWPPWKSDTLDGHFYLSNYEFDIWTTPVLLHPILSFWRLLTHILSLRNISWLNFWVLNFVLPGLIVPC